jgi:hypothetical protein
MIKPLMTLAVLLVARISAIYIIIGWRNLTRKFHRENLPATTKKLLRHELALPAED